MQTKGRDLFTTIHIEGAILPPDLLQRISNNDSTLDGLDAASFHLVEGEKLNEAISRSWNRMLGAWSAFREHLNKLPESDMATTLTREKWLLHLFRELGYGRLIAGKAVEIEGKSYPISHMWQNTPVHLVGYRVDLDKRTAGVAGAARSSPHSMVQEFLNRSDQHLWALLSNGNTLRILRDNISLTRQAYVEFDLEAMMNGEVYADFIMLWLLCHQSRAEAERPESCWLEKWSKAAQEQGTRALDQLRRGVEDAIAALGRGFLLHKANHALRDRLRQGELDKQDFYRQLLRLVYRLIFLFVAEDRQLLLLPKADASAKEAYLNYYSLSRLRMLAMKRRGSKHCDLYCAFTLITHKLGDNKGCPELALPALGGFLFKERATADLMTAEISNRFLLDAIRSLAVIVDGKTRRLVDYKNLGAEELGSIYESLLELHPELNVDSGDFALRTVGGHERKSTGSYYTPSSLIQVLLDSALNPVLQEAVKQEQPEQALLDIKICDPACGSGHFLIAAAHRMAHRLAAVQTGEQEPTPEAVRSALRQVIGHCIYGVDINEMAVELCKVSLWMEALEPGKPLSFLDHRIRCGNSLLGATPKALQDGIPDEAFNPIEGDDTKICSQYKAQNKREHQTQQTDLLYSAEQPWNQLSDYSGGMIDLGTVADETIETVQQKEKRFAELINSREYLFGRLLADVWCTAFVWKKTKAFSFPITEQLFRTIESNPEQIPLWMLEEVEAIKNRYQFFHWHLMFPDVFQPAKKNEKTGNEQTGWNGGFDVVLGNPPWERIKLQEKEWFAERHPDIANAANAAQRHAMIEELKSKDKALHAAFLEDKRKAEGESHLVRHSGLYPLNGRGDINTYAVFAELKRHIINTTGRVGCIVPSGIATDDTTKFFFQDVSKTQSLVSLYDFENRKALFPGVHRSYKFCLLTLSGAARPVKGGADFVFFAHAVDDLREQERHFTLTEKDIRLINPNTRTCPIFRSKRDAEITKEVYRRVPVLIDENDPKNGNPWGIRFSTMFHMSNDSHLFRTREELEEEGWELQGNVFVRGEDKYLPLYEAKMIHHYDHRWATYEPDGKTRDVTLKEKQDPHFSVMPRYWVAISEVQKRLRGWDQDWLFGYRNITNVTNERTIIGTVFPLAAVGHSAPIIMPMKMENSLVLLLASSLSTYISDFLARQKVGGTNLTYSYLNQIPVFGPEYYMKPGIFNKLHKSLINNINELFNTATNFPQLTDKIITEPFTWDEGRRFLIRCELDATYFHLYDIARDDVDYIMETFPIVKRKDEQKYGEYRTKRVILEMYDQMAEAMQSGKTYQTWLDPPPGDERVTHK